VAIFLCRPRGIRILVSGLLVLVLLGGGCGRYQPVPAVVDPHAYRQVSVKALKAPGPAGLAAGDKIKLEAYFWEFVNYDPAMLRNYLTGLRNPIAWSRLEWAAVYGRPQMRDYYDRVVLDREQRRDYRLKRMDHLLIYGELAPMAGGLLYLRVHRVARLDD